MRYRAIAVLATGALLVAGCSTGDDPDDAAASPAPTGGEQTPAQTPGEGVAPDDTMLLPPEQMPAWNNAGTWVASDEATFSQVCPLTEPASLGATATLDVTYEYVVEVEEGETADPSAEPMLGGNVLASFDDEAAATAAIEAWRAELAACSDVGEITQFDTGVTWTGNDLDEATELSWFDFTGIAAKGATTTTVGFSLQGQDANYESDPLEESMTASLDGLP
ncbi:MAG: hypothetical protein WCA29_12790 [Jiangellales bacterium]